MNYSNHNLRTNLQEWKNRLHKAPYEQFGHQFKYFLNNLSSKKQLAGILKEISNLHKYDCELLATIHNQISSGTEMNFESLEHQAAFCYQFLRYFTGEYSYDIHQYSLVPGSNFEQSKSNLIEEYISPIIYVLHDRLDKSSSVIYLLEKYKRRTEWFTNKNLLEQYNSASANYEQILEDDLRLFLFDQGIDYPFSTPSSASGRADIIGEIDTEDPLVVEIKIFDKRKNYGKTRIKDGFSQIVKYANDYNKDVGYLVIYNMNEVELNFNFNENNNVFPPSIYFNNKIFYFIVINCSIQLKPASKIGYLQEVMITESDLTKK
jgi:hypothetical protein